ncbi:hypothetical protein FKW77_007087 [Venturia effusa]|uniref:Heme haloperoxidase family profile domain-containing protein n=1 Tax=Venturia effusa TaxID=50376 RepID=A0A517LFU3_9PEZI|nr:hypothetical protein FKW77_007087 [Venturia effusa]
MPNLSKDAFLQSSQEHSPRDGRRISKLQFDRAQIDALNFAPDFASALSTGMLSKLNQPLDTALFDLDQLNAHGLTEHDVSISRLDKNQGNYVVVNPPLVQQFLADSSSSWLDTTSVARTRNRRTRDSQRAGNGPIDQGGLAAAQGEASLVLLVMSDEIGAVTAENADALKCPKARVQRWLLDERFPVLDGFRKPRRQIAGSELAAITQRVTFWEGQDQNRGGNGGADRGDGGRGVGDSGRGNGGRGGVDNGQGPGGPYGGNNNGGGGISGGNNGGSNGGFNGGRPGDYNGGRPGDSNGGRPGDSFNGGRPGDYNSGGPGNFNGARPGDYNGGRPGDFNGGKPGNYNGGRPSDFNGGRPGDYYGGRPGGWNGGGNGRGY